MAEKSEQFTEILEQKPQCGGMYDGAAGAGGGTHIGGYFDPAVAKQLRRLAVDEECTLTDLVAEAIDLLFQSRGLPEIARPQEVKGG